MEHANPNLRSLLCFEEPLPNCTRQRLLKVLFYNMGEYRSIECEWFHGLTQLRYCELGEDLNNNTLFESFISNLKFVETLDFRLLRNHSQLPDDIWKVKTLRRVKLCRYSYGPFESWNAKLPKLPNVRDLDILMMSSFSWDLTAKLLDTLKHLTRLSLAGYEVPPEIVDMQMFPFYQHFIRPLWLSLEVEMFSIHITEFKLNNFKFMDDPLVVLENLRSLRVLELAHSQVGFKMSCSAGGFQQLHQLQFVGLNNLEKLEIKAGAMPMLKVRMLSYCNNLQVPLGLRYLFNLKELNISWCHKLKEDEINIQDVCKHVPSIIFGLGLSGSGFAYRITFGEGK